MGAVIIFRSPKRTLKNVSSCRWWNLLVVCIEKSPASTLPHANTEEESQGRDLHHWPRPWTGPVVYLPYSCPIAASQMVVAEVHQPAAQSSSDSDELPPMELPSPRRSARGSWWWLTSLRSRSRRWLTGSRPRALLPHQQEAPQLDKEGPEGRTVGAEGQGDGQDQWSAEEIVRKHEVKVWQAEAADLLRFWQQYWTDCKGPVDPAPLRFSQAPPHRPGQKEGHCQCKYIICFLSFISSFWCSWWNCNRCLNLFTLNDTVSYPDEGQAPSQGSSVCSGRGSLVRVWVWCRW